MGVAERRASDAHHTRLNVLFAPHLCKQYTLEETNTMSPPSHRPSVEGARSLGKDGRTYVARSAAPRPRSSDRR